MRKNVASFAQNFGSSAVYCLGAGLLFALTSTSAQATVVTYLDPSQYEAAAPGVTNYSFPDPTGNDPLTRPYIDGPLGFSTTEHQTRLYLEDDPAYGGSSYLETINPYLGPVNAAVQPQVSNIYDVSFDLATRNGADTVSVSVNFQAVTSFTTVGGAPNTTFIGITDTVPIQQVSFTLSNGDEIDLLDFSAGTMAPVPEPSTYAWVGAALAGGGFLYRRRRALAPSR